MGMSPSTRTQNEVNTVVNFPDTYIHDLEPCFFPALTDGPTAKESPQIGTVRIPTQVIPDLSHFCGCHYVTASAVFETVWALLLRCFTGNSDVCFGHLPTSSRQTDPIPIHVRFVDTRSVKETVREVEDGKKQAHKYRKETQPLGKSRTATPIQLYNTVVTQRSSANAQNPTEREDTVRYPSSITVFATKTEIGWYPDLSGAYQLPFTAFPRVSHFMAV